VDESWVGGSACTVNKSIGPGFTSIGTARGRIVRILDYDVSDFSKDGNGGFMESDPSCKASHKPGDLYQPWQHTETCKEALKGKVLRQRRFTEMETELPPARPQRNH
jgi:hypothetical protein